MNRQELGLPGCILLNPEPAEDNRGFFLKYFSEKLYQDLYPEFQIRQVNLSYNRASGTFRGLHYQAPPNTEMKAVTCLRGSVTDILLDLRKNSPSFLKHIILDLSAKNRRCLLIPAGIAHGFITLEDDTELLYFHGMEYSAADARTIQVNDPQLGIQLTREVSCISDADRLQPILPADFGGLNV